ncbi:MAG: response regulator [Sandaracinus sp.]|nr:response regulator [Sandaracinus sp.]
MEAASRVLLVEDNPDLADNVSEILEELGVVVTVAHDGYAAVDAASEGFDVAVVDVGLPGVSGVDLLPKLRHACPDSETILVTGHGTLESAIAAVRHGAFAYLLKPVDPEALLGVVERALAQVSLRRERAFLARALSESETLYRGVVENVDALIVSLDREGRVLFANRSAMHALGDEADLRGVRFVDVFGDASMDARGAVRERQCPLVRPDGSTRTIRWTFTPVEQEGDIARIAIGVDVTETLALRKRSTEAEALAAIGTLTAGLAHEIRNPLNAASLQLQLLRRRAAKVEDETLRTKLSEPVELVLVELGRLTTMLDDFLGLARPQEAERERIELEALVRDVTRLQAPLCSSHGLRLEVDVEPELVVVGDRHRLQQVLVNLVVNAREAMLGQGTGSAISIVARREADLVSIEVCDDGPGLQGEATTDPFAPFVTTKAAGTGLGLAIVRKIARMHGGEVSLRNGAEGGAVARLTLPLVTG